MTCYRRSRPRDEIDEAMRDVVDPELGINVVDSAWSTTDGRPTATPATASSRST